MPDDGGWENAWIATGLDTSNDVWNTISMAYVDPSKPSAAPSLSLMPTLGAVDDPVSLVSETALATQDSTCRERSASRAIDGNTSGNWGDGSTMNTCQSANPWWKVIT